MNAQFGKHSGIKLNKPPEPVKKPDGICLYCGNKVYQNTGLCAEHIHGAGDKHNIRNNKKPKK
jgi:hypothetical protein